MPIPSLVSVHISYPAIDPAPLRYVTKLTCTAISVADLHTDEGAPDGYDISLPSGSWVHQETKAVYEGGITAPVITKDFQVEGGSGPPTGIEVTWLSQCLPPYKPLTIIVEGVAYEGEGEVPVPNGSFKLTWKPAEQEWTYIQELNEWATGRSGFSYGASCNLGAYYRRVNIWPSMEPIGGGANFMGLPVILDSGAGQFSTSGTATISFRK